MEIGTDSPYHWTNLVSQMTNNQNKQKDTKSNRKDRRREKNDPFVSQSDVRKNDTKQGNTIGSSIGNIGTNTDNAMFMNLLSSLLPSHQNTGIDNEMNSKSDTEGSIRVKIANLVLHKLGITDEKFKKYIDNGEGLEVTSMVQDLLNKVNMKTKGSKLYDFLIVVQYEGGSYGYIEYTGTYSDAKKHSLRCLAKEFGQDMFLEKDTLISSHPIYTVGHQHVKCTVIPHIKGIWSS